MLGFTGIPSSIRIGDINPGGIAVGDVKIWPPVADILPFWTANLVTGAQGNFRGYSVGGFSSRIISGRAAGSLDDTTYELPPGTINTIRAFYNPASNGRIWVILNGVTENRYPPFIRVSNGGRSLVLPRSDNTFRGIGRRFDLDAQATALYAIMATGNSVLVEFFDEDPS